jgi:excisionase family DNA binding protein
MTPENFVTIPQLAKLLGLSRIAVYNRVKKGQIQAARIGRTYVITDEELSHILGDNVSEGRKKQIDAAVERTAREFGEVLKFLGDD